MTDDRGIAHADDIDRHKSQCGIRELFLIKQRSHNKIADEKIDKADDDKNHLVIPVCSSEMAWEKIDFIDDEIAADRIKDRDDDHRDIQISLRYLSSSLQGQAAPCDHAGNRKDEISCISNSETGEKIETDRCHDQ